MHFDVAVAEEQAVRFGVPSLIHPEDYLYIHHINVNDKADQAEKLRDVTRYYFWDGDRSAQKLHTLIRKTHHQAFERKLSLLEFASGYGCVSRHLNRMQQNYQLASCDIHQQAVDFLETDLGVTAIPSVSKPAEFDLGRKYDVVFALSFFSHMPPNTFEDWLGSLFAVVAENGILIFTTHGRIGYGNVNRPPLDPKGFWFAPLSEQKDLPTDEYGCMIATPSYVLRQLLSLEHAEMVTFDEASWWETQDVYIIRKRTPGFYPPAGPRSETTAPLNLDPARLDQRTIPEQNVVIRNGAASRSGLSRVLHRVRRSLRKVHGD